MQIVEYKSIAAANSGIAKMAKKGWRVASGPTPQQKRRFINFIFFLWPKKTTYLVSFAR